MSSKQTESQPESSSDSNTGFALIMKWSVIMLVIAIVTGYAYRLIMPVELYLDESEYQQKVFTEFETPVTKSASDDSEVAGLFEGGSILYALEEENQSYLVRPFAVSGLDSVWIPVDSVTIYTEENYRRWQYEEERRKYDLD
jgi:hypothetical protein